MMRRYPPSRRRQNVRRAGTGYLIQSGETQGTAIQRIGAARAAVAAVRLAHLARRASSLPSLEYRLAQPSEAEQQRKPALCGRRRMSGFRIPARARIQAKF